MTDKRLISTIHREYEIKIKSHSPIKKGYERVYRGKINTNSKETQNLINLILNKRNVNLKNNIDRYIEQCNKIESPEMKQISMVN